VGLFRTDSLSGLSTTVGILLLEVQLFRQGVKSKVPGLDYLNNPYLQRHTMLFSPSCTTLLHVVCVYIH